MHAPFTIAAETRQMTAELAETLGQVQANRRFLSQPQSEGKTAPEYGNGRGHADASASFETSIIQLLEQMTAKASAEGSVCVPGAYGLLRISITEQAQLDKVQQEMLRGFQEPAQLDREIINRQVETQLLLQRPEALSNAEAAHLLETNREITRLIGGHVNPMQGMTREMLMEQRILGRKAQPDAADGQRMQEIADHLEKHAPGLTYDQLPILSPASQADPVEKLTHALYAVETGPESPAIPAATAIALMQFQRGHLASSPESLSIPARAKTFELVYS